MDAFREFRAKSIDEAIHLACQALGVDRDALEIDIVSPGSPGIFGLGAKKAVLRARRRSTSNGAVSAAATPLPEPEDQTTPDAEMASDDEFLDHEETPNRTLSEADLSQLQTLATELLGPMLAPLCGATPAISVRQEEDGLIVRIDDETHQGLIIGREGSTILALQYIFNRMLAKRWPQAPRVQLDTGSFRARQMERLQAMARALASRAKRSGRVQSTQPLSSFHRRMVHLALQEDSEVRTASKGQGPLKRVLIYPARRRRRTKEA
jgi:spoIIIJ-associated protein